MTIFDKIANQVLTVPANQPESTQETLTDAQKVEVLRKALQEVMGLIESQQLVRNIDGDGESGWSLRFMGIIRVLQNAVSVLDVTE